MEKKIIRKKITDTAKLAKQDAENSLNEYLYISNTHPDGSKAYLLSVLTHEKLEVSKSLAGNAYKNSNYTPIGSIDKTINILTDFYYNHIKKWKESISNIDDLFNCDAFNFIKSLTLIKMIQDEINKTDGSEIFTKETNTSYENKRDHSSGEKATSTPKPKRYFESIIKIKEPEKVSEIMTNIKGIKDELVRENNHLPIQIINIMLSLEECGYIEMRNIKRLADSYFNSFGYKNNATNDLNSLRTSFHDHLPKPSSKNCYPAYTERIRLNE